MRDKYASLAALKAELRDEQDYRVRLLDRWSWATIIAPHGGFIEAGTSALARATAGRNYNYYDFQGLQAENPLDLHITSTRFRDPLLSPILRRSCAALSYHCMGPVGEPIIWLGGLDLVLKDIVLENLRKNGFVLNPDSPRYRGESPNNVVNLACNKGVQLELSQELMSELFAGESFHSSGFYLPAERFNLLVQAVRLSLRQYKQRRGASWKSADLP